MLPFCDESTFSPDICGQIDLPTDSYEIPAKDTLSEFDCRNGSHSSEKNISNVLNFQGNFQYEVQWKWGIFFTERVVSKIRLLSFIHTCGSVFKISKNHFLIEKTKNAKLLFTGRIFRFWPFVVIEKSVLRKSMSHPSPFPCEKPLFSHLKTTWGFIFELYEGWKGKKTETTISLSDLLNQTKLVFGAELSSQICFQNLQQTDGWQFC